MLHLPAFGDEMNKARAMTARAARAFAARGCAVLQIDLLGCGDSTGDHADATLGRWLENLSRALDWLDDEFATAGTAWLWSLRSGTLLVPALLEGASRDPHLLLWQPTVSGAQQLNQLLRQKCASGLVGAASDGAGVKALREQIGRGETLEIGGYSISPGLAAGLEKATFEVPSGYRGRVAWFELTMATQAELSPAARTKISKLRASGVDVAADAIRGPGFWQSAEIEKSESLIAASVKALESSSAVPRDTAVF